MCAVLNNDRSAHHGNSPLPPFPSEMMSECNAVSKADVRAASTGGILDEKEPLVLASVFL